MSSDTYEVQGVCHNCNGKNDIILKKGVPANSKDSVIISEEMECTTDNVRTMGFYFARRGKTRMSTMSLSITYRSIYYYLQKIFFRSSSDSVFEFRGFTICPIVNLLLFINCLVHLTNSIYNRYDSICQVNKLIYNLTVIHYAILDKGLIDKFESKHGNMVQSYLLSSVINSNND